MSPIDLREKGRTFLCSFKIRQQRRNPFLRASCNYLYIQFINYYRLTIQIVLIILISDFLYHFMMSCVYMGYVFKWGVIITLLQIKMIQNSQQYSQDYQYFSNPQIIQEIRQNLTPFANYDDRQHQDTINSLSEKIGLFLLNSVKVGQSQSLRICEGIQQIMQGTLQELRSKSNNLASVASLSIKMIDFITQQSANYYQTIEDYQLQVDRLQNIIHDLNNKNNIIQTDVQIFKEQLEAARNQLDQITELREENLEQLQPNEDLLQSLRQSRIQCLEVELEKMRAQLSYYKASGLSRGSLKCEDMGFKNQVQTKSLFYLNQNDSSKSKNYLLGRSEYQEDTLVKYSIKNKQLQQENERLRIQINNYRCSQQNLGLQSKVMGKSKSLARVKTSKNINTNSSTSFFDFTEFFTLLKSKHHEKLQNICQEREAELQQLQTERKSEQQEEIAEKETVRHLRSEWSRCSLGEYNHPQLYEPPQLIYLTHESQDIPNNESNDLLFESSPTKISVSRQTEASSCDPASFESVGINTVVQSETIVVQERKESWVTRMLKGLVCNAYVDRIKDLVVTKRIKQKVAVVNRGAMQLSK